MVWREGVVNDVENFVKASKSKVCAILEARSAFVFARNINSLVLLLEYHSNVALLQHLINGELAIERFSATISFQWGCVTTEFGKRCRQRSEA
jgi:hypothetical protein